MNAADQPTSTALLEYADVLRHNPEASPYLQPVYLNTVTPGWTLIQSGDYWFPLVSRHLMWLRLSEQPLLTQLFALVGARAAEKADYTRLLNQLSAQFSHIDLCLDTTEIPLPPGWKSQERITYRLQLPESPELLRSGYSQHLRRLLKKPSALNIRNDVPIAEFMPFLKENLADKTALPASFYKKAAALLQQPGLSWQICGAYTGHKLVAACAILAQGNQRYYQLAANAPAGKNENAMHHLLDRLMTSWCGQPILFDFEGSMIAGLQRFYGGFGANPYIYTRVSYSKLPWPLSLWKHGIRSE